jgi:DNA-binding CsgD family transcriptional regulator
MRRGSRKDDSPCQARVTARESEILGWVAVGKSDWAIGRLLAISGKTVNFHVENAKRKLGVATRVQAVVVAMRDGIIR